MRTIVLQEEISGCEEADACHSPAHGTLVDFRTVMSSEVSARCCEKRHLKAEVPFHPARQDERDGWSTDRDCRSEDFERVHFVNIVDSADAQQSHNEEAATGREIPNINADDYHADDQPYVRTLSTHAGLEPAPKRETQDEHGRRE